MASVPLETMTKDEQCPLLKVVGAGDIPSNNQIGPFGVTLAGSRRKTWSEKVPEVMSTCWMIFLLLGVCLLALYTLGIVLARKQFMIQYSLKDQDPLFHAGRDADVYYHYLISNFEATVPFYKYAPYLENMTMTYPYLRFKVFFLLIDLGQEQSSIINKLMAFTLRNEESLRRSMSCFQRRNPNIDISVIPLSRYMAMTPLKCKWRYIPMTFLSFYIRAHTIWQHGGIALDLPSFNSKFNRNQEVDYRIAALLRNRNNGIKPSGSSLKNFQTDEEFSLIINGLNSILKQVWNETLTMLHPIPAANDTTESSSRIPRTKRETVLSNNKTESNLALSINKYNITNENKDNVKIIDDIITSFVMPSSQNIINITNSNNKTKSTNIPSMSTHKLSNNIINKTEVKPDEVPQLFFFYDLSLFSGIDNGDRSYGLSQDLSIPESFQRKLDSPEYLVMSGDGKFVAAYRSFHPFLTNILSQSYIKTMPAVMINQAMYSRCFRLFDINSYCKYIEIF